MKNFRAFIICFAMLVSPCIGCGQIQQQYRVIIQDNKFGFVNSTGQIVIEPTFDAANEFNEGVAIVKTTGRWAYIDSRGRIVLHLSPDIETVDEQSEDLSRVRVGDESTGKYTYVDGNGNFIIEPKFCDAGDLSEGFAAVAIWEYSTKNGAEIRNKKWGYLDKSGKLVIPHQFDKAQKFSEGLAAVGVGEISGKEKWGFIDKTGTFIINPQFYYVAGNFSEDLAPVCTSLEKLEWVYIDKKGSIVIRTNNLDLAYSFSEGLARIRIAKQIVPDIYGYMYLYGYIDKTGTVVIKPELWEAGDFSEGLAASMLPNGDKWGFIDKAGNTVIAPRFDCVSKFKNGLAVGATNSPEFVNYLIDKNGNIVWESTHK